MIRTVLSQTSPDGPRGNRLLRRCHHFNCNKDVGFDPLLLNVLLTALSFDGRLKSPHCFENVANVLRKFVLGGSGHKMSRVQGTGTVHYTEQELAHKSEQVRTAQFFLRNSYAEHKACSPSCGRYASDIIISLPATEPFGSGDRRLRLIPESAGQCCRR